MTSNQGGIATTTKTTNLLKLGVYKNPVEKEQEQVRNYLLKELTFEIVR